jgi:hypothetical protein
MLEEQSSNVVKGATEFGNLIYNYNRLSHSKKKDFVKQIQNIEDKGDDLTHKILETLDKTFITPLDKEDIHQLAVFLDDILDLICATSRRLIIFKLTAIDSHMKNLTGVVLEIVKKVDQGIRWVSKQQNMNKFYIDAHTLENKGDEIYYNAISKLFDKKNFVDIIKYKEIYEFFENIIDKCEDITNVIESIVVKHA